MKQKKENQWTKFIKKIGYKYRVSLINQDTLRELWFTRVSRLSFSLFFLSFFLFVFIIVTLLFSFLPIQYYLPGYQKSANRLALIHQSLQIDSLEREVEMQINFLEMLKKNIKNEYIKETSLTIDTLRKQMKPQKLIGKSNEEKKFIKEYEETEKYNLASIPTQPSEKTLIFFKPVEGVVATSYSPKENKYGISIVTSSQETVKSILEGSVIFAEYTFSNNWVIQVQHRGNYISVYKNNSKLLKNVGDKVKAGESLAITGSKDKRKEEKYFYFEIWRKGNPINPQEVITF